MKNSSCAAGMATLSFIAFTHFMDYHSFTPEIWRKVAFAGQLFLPVPWLVFSLVFARTESPAHLRKRRGGIGGLSCPSLFMLGIYLYPSFLSDELPNETVRYW